MMMDTFSIASAMVRTPVSLDVVLTDPVVRDGCQMQPRGFGMPAILAASLAGPFGNSW